MAEEHDDRIEALFHQAADLPPDQRQALLNAACANDPELHAAVERLLANDARLGADEGSAFLESPLVRTPIVSPVGMVSLHFAAKPPLPSHLGRYRLLRLLGEGGMGTVYEAEQDNPRRTVALKVVRPGFASPELLKRFHNESQILGRLRHPNIAQIYEAGLDDDGQPFFAMEFIRGLPLDEYARLRVPTLPARLELVARVCDAVQHAHDQGVIHRDLKPANILVEETGQPKVLDFGVAHVTAADLLTAAGLTQTGQVLGTPTHMSPEQLTADSAAIDHRADVYALGVILFELTAHRLPYRLENRPLIEATRLIMEEDPPRLGSINPDLRGDVETIVAKALEKDRTRRYASAADLAADLRHWLNHEPILARPPSALYYLGKFARRNKALVGGVLATGLALVLGLVGTILFAVAESRQRDQADRNAQQANHEKREAEYQTYRARVAAASAGLSNHDVAEAAGHLRLAPEPLRGWEWRHLSNRLDDSSSVTPVPDGDDGHLIVAHDQLHIGVLTSAGLRITDLEGRETATVPISPERGRRVSVAQTSRGLRVAAWIGGSDFEVLNDAGQVLCSVATGNDEPRPGAISPNGDWVCVHTGGDRKGLEVFDANSGKRKAVCNGHEKEVWTYTFSPDSSRIATGSSDRTARIWKTTTGELLAICQKGHLSTVQSVAFSPDGARLLTASADTTVWQWNVQTGERVGLPYERHSAALFSAVYSPDGKWVASAGDDRTIRVWDAFNREDVAVLHGHKGKVVEVAFTPDSQRLASRSTLAPDNTWPTPGGPRRLGGNAGDDTVRTWNLNPRAALPVLRGHSQTVNAVAFSPDGRWLASGSWDGTVRLWDAATGETCAILPHATPPDKKPVWALAFGPDGTWLATGCLNDNRLRIWDVATARFLKPIVFPVDQFNLLAVNPEGTRVATASFLNNARKPSLNVIDIASEESLLSTEGAALAYSRDGRWLAVLGADQREVQLLDARTHETAARFKGHVDQVFKAAFSPDSSTLATCSQDRTVRVWQVGSGECQVLTGHTDEVYAVAFHPDGTRLATSARDGAIWLWDVARGEEVVRLTGHEGFVWSLAFSPDGATLASGSGDSTVRLWDTAPLKTRYDARREAAALRPEAERFVEQLRREKTNWDEVVKALRADQTLSEAQRHAAFRAVMRRSQP